MRLTTKTVYGTYSDPKISDSTQLKNLINTICHSIL